MRLIEAFCELESSASRSPRTGGDPGPRHDEREVGIGQGKLASRRQLLEELDRLPRRQPRLLASPRAPEDARKLRERLAFSDAIAQLAIAGRGSSKSIDPLARLVCEVALVRPALQELGAVRWRKLLGVAERACVVLGRLSMRSSDDACAPAAGANVSTASLSPAASAWCAIRARLRSLSLRDTRVSRAPRWRLSLLLVGRASSTASRASS
jgi:hypothetical protein